MMTFDPAASGWKQRSSQGAFTQLVGPIWVRHEADNSSTYGLMTEERHTNSHGVMHGGMLMSFADHVLGWLVWDVVERRACVTVSLNSQFIAAVNPGDFVEMRGQVIRRTRSLVFVQGMAKVSERTVFTAEGIWKILGAN